MKNKITDQPLTSEVKFEGSTAEVEIKTTVNWENVPGENREEYTEALVRNAKDKKQWDKTDKKELKKDTKKEKKEHEKDAVKDDKSKVKKLKKGKPSEKKSVEEHDLKKDEKFDKEDGAAKKGKGNLPPWLNKKGDDDEEDKDKKGGDKKSDKKDSKEKDPKKKDSKKEDEKSDKKDKKSKASDYDSLWEKYAAERFDKKKEVS